MKAVITKLIFLSSFLFRGQHTNNALPSKDDLLQLRYKFPNEQLGQVFQLTFNFIAPLSGLFDIVRFNSCKNVLEISWNPKKDTFLSSIRKSSAQAIQKAWQNALVLMLMSRLGFKSLTEIFESGIFFSKNPGPHQTFYHGFNSIKEINSSND